MACAYLVGALGLPFVPMHKSEDMLVAIDGGFAHLRARGLRPDLSIGDFDSLGFVPQIGEVERYPCAKDELDLELALNRVTNEGFREVVLFGCLGGRLDFSLACLQLMTRVAVAGVKILAWDGQAWVCTLASPGLRTLSFDRRASGRFSVLAASSPVVGLCESGVAYELDHGRMSDQRPYGVSNEFIGSPATISLEAGAVHLFLPSAALAYASDPCLSSLGRQAV